MTPTPTPSTAAETLSTAGEEGSVKPQDQANRGAASHGAAEADRAAATEGVDGIPAGVKVFDISADSDSGA